MCTKKILESPPGILGPQAPPEGLDSARAAGTFLLLNKTTLKVESYQVMALGYYCFLLGHCEVLGWKMEPALVWVP